MELIGVMNSINHSFGKRAIRLCSEGAEQRWRTRTNSKSPNYTTRITDLAIAKAG
jgi:DNA polymerase V